jgi:hypothetical protein
MYNMFIQINPKLSKQLNKSNVFKRFDLARAL